LPDPVAGLALLRYDHVPDGSAGGLGLGGSNGGPRRRSLVAAAPGRDPPGQTEPRQDGEGGDPARDPSATPGHADGPSRATRSDARSRTPVRHPMPPAAFRSSSTATVRHSMPAASYQPWMAGKPPAIRMRPGPRVTKLRAAFRSASEASGRKSTR